MKYGNRKRLALLVGGLFVLAFMLPGMAEEPKKPESKSSDKAAAATKSKNKPSDKAAAANSAAITAPLKAKVNSKLIVAHKLTPVKYVAFTLNELKDPKTGKPPTATSVLTLRTGKQVAAPAYVTALNNLEKKLNAWGYSLRDKQTQVTIQELNFGKAKLQEQAKKHIAFTKGDAKAQSLATSPKEAKNEYVAAVKAFKAAAKTASKTAAKTNSKATAKTASKATSKIAKLPPGATSVLGLQPVTVTKNFNESWGDTSTFAAGVNASLTFKGTQNSAELSGQAAATCSILGNNENVLLATADITAPQTGGLSANVKVTTLGVDQVVLSQSQSGNWSKTDTFSRSLPNSFQVQYNTAIGPIPVAVIVGAKGSISVPYFVGLLPAQAMGWMIPNVQSSVFAQVGIGLDVDDTGLVAGVEVDLTLLNNKLVLFGNASQGTDTKGVFLTYSLVSRDDVTALAGSVSIFVEAEAFGYTIHKFSDTLFSFGGINSTFTPLSGGDKVYLHGASANSGVNVAAKKKDANVRR